LNSRDSFPRWKFKNRAPTSCSPGPILWPLTISFQLHAKMTEEIDLEQCIFRNFGSSVTLTLTLYRVEVTLVRICGRGLPTHQIRWKSEKLCGRTDGRTPEFQSTRSSVGDDLKTAVSVYVTGDEKQKTGSLLGVYGRLTSIVKHRIFVWGLGERVNCAKIGGPILTIYTSYDVFLCKGLGCLLRVAVIAPAINFIGVNLFNRD